MTLTTSHSDYFHEKGFLLVEGLFSADEVRAILDEMHQVIQEDCPRRILEKNGSVRSFFAPHFTSQLFDRISREERLVKPSAQLLGGPVYLHQSKLNTKTAMAGDWWEWHQDYTYWQQDDGMPEPAVLTAMIFLNDVNEFNGPLFLVPGSHRTGVVDKDPNKVLSDDPSYGSYLESAGYMTSLTSDLKYKLKRTTLLSWTASQGLFSAKGPAGSVLFFHGNVFHASPNNLSPWDRYSYLLTYNRTDNRLMDIAEPRPEFLASRSAEAISPVCFSPGQDNLRSYSSAR